MNRVEFESFIKSFLLFFISLGILVSTLFYLDYNKEVKQLDDLLFSQMRVCSFDLDCENFEIDFAKIASQELYTLYKNSDGLDAFFVVNGASDYYLRLHFTDERYAQKLKEISNKSEFQYFTVLLIIFVLSILFSLYALYPLRSALLLTQEFIKDILHDFNTPLSSLRLNSFMLKREFGENEKILRIEHSVQNILNLQENLKAYLFNYESAKEMVDVKELVIQRFALIEKNYADIKFVVDIDTLKININLNAFTRVLDNILTNAAKYNKKDGKIFVTYDKKTKYLIIEDNGKGIKNPSKIFERFYKEQERGIGIGLHIVKKLCDELKIKIKVESQISVGTRFGLGLTNY